MPREYLDSRYVFRQIGKGRKRHIFLKNNPTSLCNSGPVGAQYDALFLCKKCFDEAKELNILIGIVEELNND